MNMVYYEEEKVNFSIVEKNACLNEGKWDTDAALKDWCEVFGCIDSFVPEKLHGSERQTFFHY